MVDFHSTRSHVNARLLGGASGIGLATVKVLLTNGITKLSLIDINPSTLSEATSSLAELFPSASILSLKVNCSVEAEVEDAVAKTVGFLNLFASFVLETSVSKSFCTSLTLTLCWPRWKNSADSISAVMLLLSRYLRARLMSRSWIFGKVLSVLMPKVFGYVRELKSSSL